MNAFTGLTTLPVDPVKIAKTTEIYILNNHPKISKIHKSVKSVIQTT